MSLGGDFARVAIGIPMLCAAASSCRSSGQPRPPETVVVPTSSSAPSSVSSGKPAASGALEAFEVDGKFGFKDASGRVVISPRYGMALPFSPAGIAAVVDEHGWVYIDRTGADLLHPFVIDNGPDDFQEGKSRYVEGGKIGFIDEHARVVIRATFDFVLPFSEGRAAYCTGCKLALVGESHEPIGGIWGFLDTSGKPLIPPRFDRADSFHNGRARVLIGGRNHQVDLSGAVTD